MNIWDILILVVVACVIILAVWRIKNGKVKGCSCGCSACGNGCDGCAKCSGAEEQNRT